MLYQYSGCFVNQVIRSNPVGTSTVVHEVVKKAELRFDKKYKYAGEDYMMWVALARQFGNVYFCSETTVVYGSGVNIFSGAAWGSKHLSLRIIDELQYRFDCLALPEISTENSSQINVKIQELRAQLRSNALAQAKRLDLSGLWLWWKHR